MPVLKYIKSITAPGAGWLNALSCDHPVQPVCKLYPGLKQQKK